MTEREKIIELAVELGIGWAEGLSGMDDFLVTFYRKAQREALVNAKVSIPTDTMEQTFQQYHTLGYKKGKKEALEQAAKVCEKKWRKEDSFDSHANAKEIRQLIKE